MRFAVREPALKAKFVDRESPEPEWKAIHRVADRFVPAFRRGFIDATETLRASARGDIFNLQLAKRDVGGVLSTLDFHSYRNALDSALADLIRDTVVSAARVSQPFLERQTGKQVVVKQLRAGSAQRRRLAARLGVDVDDIPRTLTTGEADRLIRVAGRNRSQAIGRLNQVAQAEGAGPLVLSFTQADPRAIQFAGRQGAELVVQIEERTRRGIREIVAAGQAAELDVASQARRIRDLIGLTPRDSRAVLNFRQQLVEQGLSEREIDERVQRFYDKKLGQRATLIARTETINASSAGQQALWETAADQGFIDPNKTKRVWIVTPDDRLDLKICAPMAGQRVGLNEPFTTGDGRRIMNPTAHPGCRCSVSLEIE